MSRLIGIRAYVFDAYGTVFDFASASARCPDVPEEKRAALTTIWRDKQLQYTWLRSLQNRYVDFWQVSGEALDFALESLDLARPALRAALMDLYCTLSAFPESPDMLRQLRQAGFVAAILSNGSTSMLEAAIRNAGLEAYAPKRFRSSPRTAGTRSRRPISACVSCGATATASVPNGCPASLISRYAASPNCRLC